MWIIFCIEVDTQLLTGNGAHHFIVGPFGTDDQANDIADTLQATGRVVTDVQPLIEPARAMAGATL